MGISRSFLAYKIAHKASLILPSTRPMREHQSRLRYITPLSASLSPTLNRTSTSHLLVVTCPSLRPILDPTHLEELLSTGTLTLTLNAQRELCVMSKAGGTPLAVSEIMGVLHVAVERVRTMVKILEEALDRDRSTRVVEVR